MATQQPTVNKQTFYIAIFVVFIVGFISGVGFTVFKMDSTPGTTQGNVTQQQGMSAQENQAILNLEAEVTANPENYNGWTQLGHLYFDSDQYQKAIGAYTKSLELHSGDANLWTDLGVMYRRTGDSTKAIESFDKAIAMNTNHQPSLLNKGIVLYYDFGKVDEAIATWQTVLEINPKSMMANGTPLNDFINQIREEQKNNSGS
jgi:cytochrome c-type biogenesis protein CcmH/NrfG